MTKREWTLEAVNDRLKSSGVRVRLRQRGNALSLVATLPPKPSSPKPRAHQQSIALSLPATHDGLKRAEAKARELGADLLLEKFDWRNYLPEAVQLDRAVAAVVIERFKVHYLRSHSLKDSSWRNHWEKVFQRLPPHEPLSVAMLMTLVERTERDSRNRLETCRKLQALADFAGLSVNLLQFKGSYSPAKVRDRDIPSDEAIADWWNKIPNPAWQWVYGAIAAYGLRPHEAFFCEWSANWGELQITRGKTGPRLVFQPLFPEWVEQWNLIEILRPNIDPEAQYDVLGYKVTRQLKRYGVPFEAYALRHAYAIRASVTLGIPVTTAAALLGHSSTVHLQKYHRHITLKTNREAARAAIARPDRPLPPRLGGADLPPH